MIAAANWLAPFQQTSVTKNNYTQGAMMAVFGLKTEVVKDYQGQFRDHGHFIHISNFNCPPSRLKKTLLGH